MEAICIGCERRESELKGSWTLVDNGTGHRGPLVCHECITVLALERAAKRLPPPFP